VLYKKPVAMNTEKTEVDSEKQQNWSETFLIWYRELQFKKATRQFRERPLRKRRREICEKKRAQLSMNGFYDCTKTGLLGEVVASRRTRSRSVKGRQTQRGHCNRISREGIIRAAAWLISVIRLVCVPGCRRVICPMQICVLATVSNRYQQTGAVS